MVSSPALAVQMSLQRGEDKMRGILECEHSDPPNALLHGNASCASRLFVIKLSFSLHFTHGLTAAIAKARVRAPISISHQPIPYIM
jgi:hypothetical protein